MVQRPQLKVQKRKILGKKVKRLRSKGVVPINLFGKKIKSQSLQISFIDFIKVFKKAGETTIIDLLIDKAKKPHHTLIRNVQLDPVSDQVLHVDFMQVDLKEKIETDIPIKLKGESPAVQEKRAMLLQELDELTIEAAADKLPDHIDVDVSKLKEVGKDIRVKDLKVDKDIDIKTDLKRVVVRLDELVSKEAEELEKKEEEEATEAAAEAAKETKPEEEKKEEKVEEAKEEKPSEEKPAEKDEQKEQSKQDKASKEK